MTARQERAVAPPPQRESTPLRALRDEARLSQSAFAALLGVSPERYRTWDAGRRPVPDAVLAKAVQLTRASRGGAQPLYVWADHFGIHVCTLRQAAHAGRLEVTYGSHVFFGKAVPLATDAAVQRFKARYYRRTTRWNRPTKPAACSVPGDYAQRLIAWRQDLRLSQAALAVAIGAANRAVVYQWESRRRTPSPLFWQRILALCHAQTALPRRP